MGFDKFPVIAASNEGVAAGRRLEAQVDGWKARPLAKSPWIFRQNPPRHTEQEQERLEQRDWKHWMTVTANRMRLIPQNLYERRNVTQARKDFLKWGEWVTATATKARHALLHPMVQVAGMVERPMEGILGHWKDGLTTAFLEGLNRLFSATKRQARGYRPTKNLLAMLRFVAGKLKVSRS